MKRLVFLVALSAALQIQILYAQESSPSTEKRPSALAGTDSLEALREHVPVLPVVRAKYWNIDPAVGYGMKDFGNMASTRFLTTVGNPPSLSPTRASSSSMRRPAMASTFQKRS